MTAPEPIAIVGMACRFPGGANDPATYFRRLLEGYDAITEVPKTRWDVDEFFDPDPAAPGKTVSRWGGFLDGAEMFDAALFGVPEHEAAAVDPQQRLLLEVSWEALERAGYSPRGLAGTRGGVFVGLGSADYLFRQLQHLDTLGADAVMGTPNVAPGRISQYFGLRGPSLLVDTACSSGLVAIHLASQSLRAGECDLALVGAANVIASPSAHVVFSRARLLAPDGRCKSFDAAADGYVRAEGCAVLVLKTLSRAQADRDRVLCVIRGSAVNHAGRGAGMGVPDVQAQAEVVSGALASARVAESDVTYVDAHGTGTPLGDALEVRALAAVLLPGRTPRRPLLLSAVKPNLGHCEAASSLASLVKAVGCLQTGEIPAIRGLRSVHPEITHDRTLVFAQRNLDWPAESPRVAGVHAYSVVGTNAHVVLEAPPALSPRAAAPAEPERSSHLLVLSARSPRALWNLAHRYEEALRTTPEPDVADVCFTAGTARAHLPHRLAVVGATVAEIVEGLALTSWGRPSKRVARSVEAATRRPKVAFAFSGSGHDPRSLTRELARTDPGFRRDVEACLDGARMDLPPAAALFLLQHGLGRLVARWGIKPHVVLGEEVGELAAACAAGVLDPREVLVALCSSDPSFRPAPARTRMISLVTGSPVPRDVPLQPAHFARALTGATLRGEALASAAALGCDVVLELGPHPTLRQIGIQHAPRLAYLPALEAGRDPWGRLLATTGQLYVRGQEIDWRELDAGRERVRVEVPTYPFERVRFWDDNPRFAAPEGAPGSRHRVRPLLKVDDDLSARLSGAANDDRVVLVAHWLREQVCALLGAPAAPTAIDGSVPLRDLGLDSLGGVDLLSLLTAQFARAFPATLFLEHPTLDAVTAYLSRASCDEPSK